MYRLTFKPEVYDDIKTAYDWYEAQRAGLGEDFLLTLEEFYVKITRNPKLYQDIYKSVKRKLVRRFPYGIFFVLLEDMIIVLAVLHTKREPQEWHGRV
jgi:plasmid stabilization system protein ParE